MTRPYHFPGTGIYEESKEVYSLLDKAMLNASLKLLAEAVSELNKVLSSADKEPELLGTILDDLAMARSDLSVVLSHIK